MKRVTILFDDEQLYRDLKAAAAREGRTVKDVAAEALGKWLHHRSRLSDADRERRLHALQQADELRERQPVQQTVDDILSTLREERS